VAGRQDGYKAHVAIEPDTGIIIDCALTQASGTGSSDAAAGIELVAGEPESVTVLADSAYGSGELRAELAAGGHIDVVKAAPLRPAVAGGFTVDDFTVDDTTRTVTCPAGAIRDITRAGNAIFETACRSCDYGPAAPPAPPGRRCTSDRTTRCKEPLAYQPEIRTGRTNIANTGRWSNAPSPG
jgi:hypothetical protein